MMRIGFGLVAGLALALGGCGGGKVDGTSNEAAADNAIGEITETAEAGPKMPPCPFKKTESWVGSWEGGKLLVNGKVDLMMAGFKPVLTPRNGSSGSTLALDLTLVQETGAAVNDMPRYERTGAPAYRRGEIWCGGDRIAAFDMIIIN